MAEPAPAKRCFTRQRVIVVALLLVVAGFVFGWLGGNPANPVKVRLAGFTNSVDGKSILATPVLTTKHTGIGYPLWIVPGTNLGFDPRLESRFRSPSPTGDVLWTLGQVYSNRTLVRFMSKWDPVAKAALPQDGRTGKLEIRYEVRKYGLPAPLRLFLRLFGHEDAESFEEGWAVCEQEIKCPRQLPDGTVEPARVVTKEPR